MQTAVQSFVTAEPTRYTIREEHPAERQYQSEQQATQGGKREERSGTVIAFLAQLHAYQHTGTRREQHADGEHKLRNRLGEVDGTHAIPADEITDDDGVHHIAQTRGEGNEDGGP